MEKVSLLTQMVRFMMVTLKKEKGQGMENSHSRMVINMKVNFGME